MIMKSKLVDITQYLVNVVIRSYQLFHFRVQMIKEMFCSK